MAYGPSTKRPELDSTPDLMSELNDRLLAQLTGCLEYRRKNPRVTLYHHNSRLRTRAGWGSQMVDLGDTQIKQVTLVVVAACKGLHTSRQSLYRW